MLQHREQTLARLVRFQDRIKEKLYGDRTPASLQAYAAPDRISVHEAAEAEYQPIDIGHRFGPVWSTHWVHFAAEIPTDWRGKEVHLLWDSGCEACIWKDSLPVQGLTYRYRWDYAALKEADGGEKLEFEIEVACNGLFGSPVTDFSLRHASDLGLLNKAELAVFERGAWDLLWDFATVAEMAHALPEDTPRGGQALRVANEMANLCRLDDPGTWQATRDIAAPFLAERNGDSQHNLSAIGHAHIDTAWLWPLAETHRKCVRTFATATLYMEEYPEYRFACSQAQQWDWMKSMQPALYEKMRELAREGRFIPVGGTWIEPDCNIPSGESLVRQFLVGQRFFETECGVRSNIFWNPDVFGYSGQLPQIMRGAGIEYFLTQKLSWNQFNKPPNHSFHWEGIDGSRIMAHFPPADTYNAMATVRELNFNVRNHKDHERSRESYYLFGFGDGGGGPTKEMLERLRRARDCDGLPRVEIRTPCEFFERLDADATDLQTWVGELYFELHRGTYTTQAYCKRMNRRSEELLHDVELLGAVADRAAYPAEELDRLWKLVLLNQFHDIIPGSSITEVYVDAHRDYQVVSESGARLLGSSLDELAGEPGTEVLSVNTTAHARREVVELPEGHEGLQASSNGRALGVVSAPGLGYSVAQPKSCEAPATISQGGESTIMENSQLCATIASSGRITSLVHKASGREVISDPSGGNRLLLFDDDPVEHEAWDMDVYHLEKSDEVDAASSLRVIEEGPLRVAIELEYSVGAKSHMIQRIRLAADSPRLDFECEVSWHEWRRYLKVEFPCGVRSMNATFEIQFGHLQRPTHFNTSWDIARFEVCGHRWADLAEPDFGVALLNDSKYGYAVQGNVMRLSLLRSPKKPDPQADMGEHAFTYSLMPHAGTLQDAGVITEALNLNMPLHVRATSRNAESVQWFDGSNPAFVIDTVKKAEESQDIIVRGYEAHGTTGSTRIGSSLPVRSAALCNLLEEDEGELSWQDGGVDLAFTPFQIRTLRLRLD